MTTNELLSNQNGDHAELSHSGTTEFKEHTRLEHEKNTELNNEKREASADSARHEIEKITAEHEPQKHESPTQPRIERTVDTKAARSRAYQSIMAQARSEMPAPQRAFSHFIHNPVIDRVSSIAAKTVARPDAILSGSVFAFALTLVIYLIAKQSGYALTGTETIASFIAGWILGNVYDYIKTLIRGNGS